MEDDNKGKKDDMSASEMCKHCHLLLTQDDWGNWRHAEGLQRGKLRCAADPYGFHAEPEWMECSDNPANPCNGSRGLIAVPVEASYGTSVKTGIAEDIDMPIIRTGKTNIEDVGRTT